MYPTVIQYVFAHLRLEAQKIIGTNWKGFSQERCSGYCYFFKFTLLHVTYCVASHIDFAIRHAAGRTPPTSRAVRRRIEINSMHIPSGVPCVQFPNDSNPLRITFTAVTEDELRVTNPGIEPVAKQLPNSNVVLRTSKSLTLCRNNILLLCKF